MSKLILLTVCVLQSLVCYILFVEKQMLKHVDLLFLSHLNSVWLYHFALIENDLLELQVLVMTAQILLNILRHSIIKMDAIHLLILDECHHAVKKHPYSLVMSEFYHTTPKDKRPAVFGMTASPVNLKGTCSFHFWLLLFAA